jgi:hypothetical protein
MRIWLLFLLFCVSSPSFAQASGVQLSSVVCGPVGLSGVTYVQAGGASVSCGTDSLGNALALQVSTLDNGGPIEGGDVVGLQIGAAVLSVFAVAWGFRVVRRFIENESSYRGGDQEC